MVEKPLTEKRLIELLKAMEERLVDQIVESNKGIISTAEKLHGEVIECLDNLELNTVKRSEFEALKRQVERLIAH